MVRKLKSKEGRIEEVMLADVLVDESYQRDVQRHVQFIRETFDPAAVGTGTVGRRSDGRMYWIDGLQRSTAMKSLGIDRWRCTVLESPGPQYEAHIFRLYNSRESRKALSANQLFKAALIEQEPTALAVKRACDSAGLKIAGSRESATSSFKSWPVVNSAGLLMRLCKSYGEESLTLGLRLLADTWPQVNDALHQHIIGGVCMVQYNYPDLDRAHWIEVVGKMRPKAIRENATGIQAQGGGALSPFADQMIARYNKGKRGAQRLRLFREKKIMDEDVVEPTKNINLSDVSKMAGM